MSINLTTQRQRLQKQIDEANKKLAELEKKEMEKVVKLAQKYALHRVLEKDEKKVIEAFKALSALVKQP